MIRSGFSPAMTSMLGCERVPTEVHGLIRLRIGSWIRSGCPSSAMPTGEMPTLASASTNEYSSATMRAGGVSIVSSPWSSWMVTARAVPGVARQVPRHRAAIPARQLRRVGDMAGLSRGIREGSMD